MDCVIRDFTPGDYADYRDMSVIFYNSLSPGHTISERSFERTFGECIKKRPYVRGLIIEAEGKTAGFSLLTFSYSNEYGGRTLAVDELYLQPEFHGKGLARELFTFVEREYKKDFVRMFLEAEVSNTHAIDVYSHLGFGRSKYILMTKSL